VHDESVGVPCEDQFKED